MKFEEWGQTLEGKHAAANVIYNGSWGTAKIAFEAGQRSVEPLPLDIAEVVEAARRYAYDQDMPLYGLKKPVDDLSPASLVLVKKTIREATDAAINHRGN